MRIAFFVGEFPSLSETFVLNQITGLIDRGHDVRVYGREPAVIPAEHAEIREYALLDRVEYIPLLPRAKSQRVGKAVRLAGAERSLSSAVDLLRSLKFWKYGRLAANLKLWYATALFRADRPVFDVIHAHFGPNGVLAAALRDLGLIEGKLVTTFHGADMTRYVKGRGPSGYSFLAREGEAFLPISDRWRAELVGMGFPSDRTRVHHMGVDCEAIPYVPPEVAGGERRILSVARLTEKKGIKYAIRAFHRCVRDLNVAATYTIVGDGEQRDALERLAADLSLRGRVKFVGWKSKEEIIDLLSESHLFLAPSVTAKSGDQEGIPVAIMEAMASGLPVVSTYHSGIPELVEDGASGLLVAERDVDALAEALASLLRNPERLEDMGKSGRYIVEERFDVAELNDRLVKIYRSL